MYRHNLIKFIKKGFGIIAVLTAMSLVAGCAGSSLNASNEHMTDGYKAENSINNDKTEVSNTVVNTEAGMKASEMFTDRDRRSDYDSKSCVKLTLNGTSATSSSNSVKISDSQIIISEEATYELSGTLTNGSVIIDADDNAKITLVLNNADITSESSAAIYVKNADKVFIILNEGADNSLTTSGEYVAIDDNNIDGAIFSKSDLTINGAGCLTVTSNTGHGIVCKDDLVITSGTIDINAMSHGINANDSVRVASASLNINAGKDGIHSENNDDSSKGFVYVEGGNITIASEGDGISAGAYMNIVDGSFNITAGGGSENGTKSSSDNYGKMPGGGFGGGFGGRGQKDFDKDNHARPEMMSGSQKAPEDMKLQRPEGQMNVVQDGDRAQLQKPDINMNNSGDNTSTSVEEDDDSVSMKGLKAAGEINITGGSITIDSADDSVHSNNSIVIAGGTYTLKTGDDGIHADESLTVGAGDITITESYEGLEALHIVINGGNINLVATDDGINAAGGSDSSGITGGRDGAFGGNRMAASNGSIVINAGDIYINASGDAIDSNGSLEITGGTVITTGPIQGDTSILDFDTTGTITGGVFIGTGSMFMAQNFTDASQGVVCEKTENKEAGTTVRVKDKAGNVIVEHKAELGFNMVIISTPDMRSDSEYTVEYLN